MTPFEFIAIFGFLGHCYGQIYQAQDYQARPASSQPNYRPPANNYAPEKDYAAIRSDAEYEVDRLLRTLRVLKFRDRAQSIKANDLRDSVNDNLGFKDEFNEVFDKEINNERTQQNGRLDNLAERIALIQGLRRQVSSYQKTVEQLRYDAEVAQEALNTVREQVTELETDDDQPLGDFIELEARAQILEDKIEVVSRRVYNSTRLLLTTELIIKKTIARSNAFTAEVYNEMFNFGYETIVNKTVPYPGFPKESLVSLTGFHFSRNKGYSIGTESLQVDQQVDAIVGGINVEAADLSSSAWTAESISNNIFGLNYARGSTKSY